MKPTLLLRIASGLAFLHAVLHTIGGVFGKQTPGAQQMAVAAMKANHFEVMGFPRTFWDFYFGMGLGVSILLLAESAVFWQLGSLAKTGTVRLRPILGIFIVGYLALALNSYLYFFPPPVIAELLIVLCLGIAFSKAR